MRFRRCCVEPAASGTVNALSNDIKLSYYRTYPGIPNPGVVHETGHFVGDCEHAQMSDSPWHRPGTGPTPAPPSPSATSPIPKATFSRLKVPAGLTVTVKIALAVGADAASTTQTHDRFAVNATTFGTAWGEAQSKWEDRWAETFTPRNSFWTGNLPTVDFAAGAGAGVARVYYMSALTVVSQARTNLPLVWPRAFPNGNGNVGHSNMGIGGSRSWWWDEALSSMLLALLEPAGRAPTFKAWFAHDDHPGTKFGHGMGNGYAMDCEPLGSGSCGFASSAASENGTAATAPKAPPPATAATADSAEPKPEYGFYCYNPWAFYMAMSNHLRVNNDTDFLRSHAANRSDLDVEAALEGIALDFLEYLIPDTSLVDYGPAMDVRVSPPRAWCTVTPSILHAVFRRVRLPAKRAIAVHLGDLSPRRNRYEPQLTRALSGGRRSDCRGLRRPTST